MSLPDNMGAQLSAVQNGGTHKKNGYPVKRIKILFMIDWLYEFGGTEKHLYQLIKFLGHDQFTCYLAPLKSEQSFVVKYFASKYCNIVPVNLDRIYTLPALTQGREIYRFIRQNNIDIVQTFGMASDNYGTLIASLTRKPVVISSRRDMGTYRTGLYRLADRISQHYIQHYLSVCDRVSGAMIDEGIEKERITRIYNGIELTKWLNVKRSSSDHLCKQYNIGPDSFVVGNISHFRPEKGHDCFFAAMRRLANRIPNLKVIALGGPGTYRDKIVRDIANDRVLRDIVTITHTREVDKFLSIFDVACLTPSSNEGFSNAILEKMAVGLPIVATDVGGNAEAVVHGETGYIIPPDDVDGLAFSLLELYQDPNKRRLLGQNARERAIKYFDIKLMIAHYNLYYQNLIKTNRAKQSLLKKKEKKTGFETSPAISHLP